MKLSSSICFSIVSALAVSHVSALVLPNFKDSNSIVEKQQSIENVPTSETTTSSVDFSAIQLVDESDALEIQFNENLIPNSYIILLKDDVSDDAFEFHRLWVSDVQVQSFAKLDAIQLDEFETSVKSLDFQSKMGGINHVFDSPGFRGYSGLFTPEVISLLRRSKDVAVIELDSTVHAIESTTQKSAPWGLSRISHRDTLGLGTYNKYLYDDDAGEGVTAYVIDTGVNIEHEEFEGRAVWGATIPSGDADVDGNGHGTHCAGTIGSKKYGVSKKAKIVAVKVLRSNGSGTMSDVVKGVEFAAKAHVKEAKESESGFKGSTANMSLGGGKSPALDLAVNAAVKAGLHFAVAAGNDNADACNYSPAAAESAITVGASTVSDARAYFSNYGKCVDIFAPGLNILSTYIGSDSATAVLSGTSMASPHVCGLLTYFLSLAPSSDSKFSSASITPKQLKDNIIKYGTKDSLTSIPEDTPNVLIYNGAGGNISDFWNYEESSSAEDLIDNSIEKLNKYTESNINGAKNEIKHLIDEIVDAVEHVVSAELI
ncbi:proteinase B [Pichia kluyveri]|uniref:Proteinase B n=1 Tax=Pichia kluyveri TaxID=36015 RepID=A0AAV5RAH4_PICKL|nr:proteinase B [Pichia kluyveri]